MDVAQDDLVTSEVHGYRSELEVEKRRRLDLEFQVVSQDGELCAVLGRLADAEKRYRHVVLILTAS
eukprot:SAG25_NODE_1115_length_3909_cov_1.707349_2_plen_66_part_00